MATPSAALERDANVLDRALGWLDEGHRVAIATVVETWGSSPRPRGSQLVVRDDGLFFGSGSGGCVEGKVVEAAQAAMQDRQSQLLEFGVSNAEAWEVGLACGGTVRIHVAPVASGELPGSIGRAPLEASRRARVEKRAIVMLTPLDGSTAVETAGGRVFVQAFNPPLRLVIMGAVHIAEHARHRHTARTVSARTRRSAATAPASSRSGRRR